LIVKDPNNCVLFVEVRQRSSLSHGGAGASINWRKQQKIIFAVRFYLMQKAIQPACRFDAVFIDAGKIQWIRYAFEASSL